MSVNKVLLLGNFGKDPELQGKDTMYCRFGIATTEVYKGKKEVTWHNCVAFGRTAETIAKYFSKGDTIFIEGKIKTEKYEGKTTTSILVHSFSFTGGQKSGEAPTKKDDEDLPF